MLGDTVCGVCVPYQLFRIISLVAAVQKALDFEELEQ